MPRQSRQAQVCATAALLFRDYGYSTATMDQLAAQVGLTKGALYYYYPSKSAILFDLMSTQLDAALELVDRVPADGTAGERMRELVRLQVDRASHSHDEILVFFQELPWAEKHLQAEQAADLRARIRKYEDFNRQLLASGVRSGEFRPMEVGMVMSSIVGILAYLPAWSRGFTGRARAALVGELTDFVMHSIAAAPACGPVAPDQAAFQAGPRLPAPEPAVNA